MSLYYKQDHLSQSSVFFWRIRMMYDLDREKWPIIFHHKLDFICLLFCQKLSILKNHYKYYITSVIRFFYIQNCFFGDFEANHLAVQMRGIDNDIINYIFSSISIFIYFWSLNFYKPPWRGVLDYLDTTLCDKVCQWLATGRWFSHGTTVFSTNKTDRHNITEILLKVD